MDSSFLHCFAGFRGVPRVMAAIGLPAVMLLAGCTGSADREALREREAANRRLAEFLNERYSPRRVLVISNPFTQESGRPKEVYQFEKAGMRGLRSGFASSVELRMVFPSLKAEVRSDPRNVFIDPATTTPLSFLMSEGAFDELAAEYPEYKLWISLIGLPVGIGAHDIWRQDDDRVFGLLFPDLRMLGKPREALEAFERGKIVAAVVKQPAKSKAPSGENSSESTSTSFLLVTKDNVAAVLSSAPEVFGFTTR